MYQVSKNWHQLCLETKLKLKTNKDSYGKTDKNASFVTPESLYVLKWIKLSRNCIQQNINLIFLIFEEQVIFPSSAAHCPFSFFLSLFFLFLLLWQCGNIPRINHTTFFEYFPCDVQLWCATNVMNFLLYYEKIKWHKNLFQEGF